MKRQAEQKTMHRMAKVHNFLEMWQGSQNLHTTQKESRAKIIQIAAVRYVSDTEEIVKASWSDFQPDGAAAFKLSEWSPAPLAVSVKDIPAGQSQLLIVCQIQWMNCIPAKCDEDCASESISDTEYWLDWNADLDSQNYSEDNWETDIESRIVLDNGIMNSETPEQRNVSALLHVPRLIRPTLRSMNRAEQVMMTVGTIDTRRSKGIKVT